MTYQQLSQIERIAIMHLKAKGLSIAGIARQMNRHKSTISRELRRNATAKGNYIFFLAHKLALTRRSVPRRNMRYSTQQFQSVLRLLNEEWSPEQITGYLRRHSLPSPSHETIYRYIWRDKAKGGLLWQKLRQAPKKRRKPYSAYDSRGRLANKRHISERPNVIETRSTQGHWEIDTVMGKGSKDCLLTLVERKPGYVEIGKLPDRSTKSLNRRLRKILNVEPRLFETITADNGTEFHQYQQVEKTHPVTFYFATPHHSWERGSNENTNGLIRQYLPKGKSMKNITQKDCDEIAHKLNMRPRKRHGFKAPVEVFEL